MNESEIKADLEKFGFTAGCLVKAKSAKTFWSEYGTPVFEQLQLEDGTYKEWVRGEKYLRIPEGTIFMFLGLLKREVDKGKANTKSGRIEVTSYQKRGLLCFLHEQKIMWWDYNSIDGGAEAMSRKLEVVSGDSQEETDTA